ncbi:sensor domain-containing protein [Mangrovihabitans endophyticus]|uniref:PknH-like extracellular domain-containing protein n=1 Tax=Mangrovihabitans endophyticus TaxID=1751298 RepID=A0A8J3C2E2_9ACTN|nr:sensor domain-containing protein [Mangrovihabitans endophyticus]GGL07851.1 hypothetical protein GCM10012284_47860 [Mangrovihabitans endophyticus]
MFEIGAAPRGVVAGRAVALRAVAACVLAVTIAGCGSSDDAPDPPDGGLITVTTMRGALLQGSDIGPTWQPPGETPDPQRLVRFCGGPSDATAVPVPPGADQVTQSLVDEGEEGAQTLHQSALVYPDEAGAQAGLAALRAVADGCRASVSVPARPTGDTSEPAFTETTKTTPLAEGQWTGFVLERHKTYEPEHPGLADTAVAVLASRNVLLVDQYAIYRLGVTRSASTGAQFDADWRKLVGTVVQRVG